MSGDDGAPWIDLSEVIEALRAALDAAWQEGAGHRVRFKLEPLELTVQAGVTRTGKGAAGVRWHVLSLGGERSREAVSTQTLKLRFAPVLLDMHGQALPEDEQLVADQESRAYGSDPAPLHEPE